MILRLVELSQERNISYKPSHEALVHLSSYCERKGLAVRKDLMTILNSEYRIHLGVIK